MVKEYKKTQIMIEVEECSPSAYHCRALKHKDRDDKTPAFGAAKEISTFIDCINLKETEKNAFREVAQNVYNVWELLLPHIHFIITVKPRLIPL